jgi:hypothetical protein
MASKQQTKETDNKPKKSEQDADQQSSKATANAEHNGADMSQELDELIEALNGDLSVIDAEGALGMIDEWHSFLHKSKEPAAKELATSLKELQKLLKSDKADGHEIGEVLEKLGEQTSNVASDAEKGTKTTIQKLGKQLTQAGKAMSKADQQEHLEEITTLIETLDSEELESVEAEAANGMIDPWYELLHKQEGEAFKELASELKKLKQVLKKSKSQPEDIAEILARLGEQTTEIASEAPRGFKTVVQKLGKQLSTAAESFGMDEMDDDEMDEMDEVDEEE